MVHGAAVGIAAIKIGTSKKWLITKTKELNLLLDSGGKSGSWLFEVLMMGNSILPDDRGEMEFFCGLSRLFGFCGLCSFPNKIVV